MSNGYHFHAPRRQNGAGWALTLETPYFASWYEPLFASLKEKRRLRIVSAILTAVASHSSTDKAGQRFLVAVGRQTVSLTLEYESEARSSQRSKNAGATDKPRLRVTVGDDLARWIDRDNDPIESHLREIATEIVVAGEIQYRNSCLQTFEWRKRRKVELEHQRRKEIEEASRRERERLEQVEIARANRLLAHASALHKANDIRNLIQAISDAVPSGVAPVAQAEFYAFQRWALAQADRLDPIINGSWRDVCPGETPSEPAVGAHVDDTLSQVP